MVNEGEERGEGGKAGPHPQLELGEHFRLRDQLAHAARAAAHTLGLRLEHGARHRGRHREQGAEEDGDREDDAPLAGVHAVDERVQPRDRHEERVAPHVPRTHDGLLK